MRLSCLSVVLLSVVAGCGEVKEYTDAGGGDDVEIDGGGDLDTTPPETTIDSAPTALSNDATPELVFSSNEPGTFVCTIDGAAAEACSSPYGPTLVDGPHTFTVAAIDDAANQDTTPAEHLWTMDTLAPETTITNGPPAIDNSTMVQISFTTDEAVVLFECALNGGAFATCTSPHTVTVTDGGNSFQVRASDPAGNVDLTPAMTSWTTDTSTPDTVINTGPSGTVASTSASFTFSSPDAGAGATFECSRDNAAFTTCTSPQPYSGLTEIAHNFRVRVRDAGGNLDPSPASRNWTVDVTAPTTTIVSGPPNPVASTSATFTFSSNETVTYQCNTDLAGFMACSTPHQPTGFGQGSHTLQVRAVDAAGTPDASPASHTWVVDTVGPAVVITSGPPANSTSGPYVTFAFTTTEGTLQCRMDTAAFGSCTSPRSYSLNDSNHTFEVRASDALNNVTTVSRPWNVDCAGQTGGTGGILLMHMDEASGQPVDNALSTVEAYLGNNATTVEVADPQRLTTGRFGRALNFVSGDRDIVHWTFVGPAGLNTHDHTVEAWVRPPNDTGTNTIFSADEIKLWFTFTTGVRFNYQIMNAQGVPVLTSSGPMPADTWYHVVATYTGTTMRLYVNGAEVDTDTISYTGTPFAIGNVILSLGGESVDGDLDEVFMGNQAFTATDVLNRYCPYP